MLVAACGGKRATRGTPEGGGPDAASNPPGDARATRDGGHDATVPRRDASSPEPTADAAIKDAGATPEASHDAGSACRDSLQVLKAPPAALRETGLYSDFDSKQVADLNRPGFLRDWFT